MGHGTSKLEKSLDTLPEGERYFGLENFGNTCYANSVLQSLYYCQPFREKVLQYGYRNANNTTKENLLTCLADLFQQVHAQKKRTGVIAPKRFVARLKHDNELFRSFQHQDAHEFLNYLVNECSEVLEKEAKEQQARKSEEQANGFHDKETEATPSGGTPTTWVHELFQGKLVNETRCLRCETVTSREEAFYDLSLEIEHNSSVSSCLRNFSSLETLDADDKFFCDACQSYQEAQKRMKIKQLPPVLCLHLKRFKYIEQYDRMRKLMYRVVFPLELKLRNVTEDCVDADETFQLFSVVVHVGSGAHHGHYVTFVKSSDKWLFFDDEQVEATSESTLQQVYGSPYEANSNCMDHGYILMYDRTQNQSTQSPQ